MTEHQESLTHCASRENPSLDVRYFNIRKEFRTGYIGPAIYAMHLRNLGRAGYQLPKSARELVEEQTRIADELFKKINENDGN